MEQLHALGHNDEIIVLLHEMTQDASAPGTIEFDEGSTAGCEHCHGAHICDTAYVLAKVVEGPAFYYATFTSGAGCEGNGAHSITTLVDCEAAAVALGLVDTTAVNDGQSSVNDPRACYFEVGCGQVVTGGLKFNSGANSGPCGKPQWSDGDGCGHDTCICRVDGSPPPALPGSSRRRRHRRHRRRRRRRRRCRLPGACTKR